MILNKVYKAFFYCEDFLHWAYKPNLLAMFLEALEIKFERGLYLHDEGYDNDANYDLPQSPQASKLWWLILPAVDPDDYKEEEDFPIASLDDLVWSEEPIPDRYLCIHMVLRKSETGYPFQIPTQLEEPI